MAVSNISTYGSLQTLLQNMNQSQNALNNDEVAIASHQVSQTFDGINGSVEQLTSLNAQVSRLQNYQSNNTTYIAQLNTTNTILGQVQTLATNVKSLIAQQLSSTGSSSAAFTQQLQTNLSSLSNLMNSSYAGNYLFGGNNISTPPVKSPIPAPTTIGTPDTNYYQGSAQTTSVRIADGQTMNNSITAADPAFQNIIGGIQQALSAVTTNNTAGLQAAETLISTGAADTTALQSTVRANALSVGDVNTQSQTIVAYYSSLTQNITQSDVVALSTKVAQDQNVLEATFATYSRISSLTLANYLK